MRFTFRRLQLYEFMGVPDTQAVPKVSFYTAALNDDINEIATSVEFGLEYTANIKIKLNDDIDRAMLILTRINNVVSSHTSAISAYRQVRWEWF